MINVTVCMGNYKCLNILIIMYFMRIILLPWIMQTGYRCEADEVYGMSRSFV